MESSRTVTSIFIVVALVAMAALAVSVNRKSAPEAEPVLLPGLTENLRSMEEITDFPADHIRSVRIVRTNGEELAVIRERPAVSEFRFATTPPESITPFSAILFANAAFLDGLRSPDASGFRDAQVISELTYTSFDELVLKFVFFQTEDATWLKIVATHSPKLEARYAATSDSGLLPTNAIIQIVQRLNGRVYKRLDD